MGIEGHVAIRIDFIVVAICPAKRMADEILTGCCSLEKG
jgi:hypothetical protein